MLGKDRIWSAFFRVHYDCASVLNQTSVDVTINISMRKITVLIADDHTIVRQGLKFLMQTSQDIDVVGEAENGMAAVQKAKELQPNVVVLDIAMPRKNGIEAAKQIAKESPASRILILSTYHEDQEVHEAIEAGAAGYMMKESASADLINAVHEIAKGHSFFSPQISRRLLRQTRNAFQARGENSPLSPSLTAREQDVLKLIAEGKPNKQIASDLGISIKTVEKHRQSLMDKLHIHEAASLTRYAIAKGIVPCNRRSLVATEAPLGVPTAPA